MKDLGNDPQYTFCWLVSLLIVLSRAHIMKRSFNLFVNLTILTCYIVVEFEFLLYCCHLVYTLTFSYVALIINFMNSVQIVVCL